MVGTLSVSGPRLDCAVVVDIMRRLGINGDVTSNTTVLDGRTEAGCRIVVASKPHRDQVERLWNATRDHFSLSCAHVALDHHEDGCVYDVFRPSNCPGG